MTILRSNLRKFLEKAIVQARQVAEDGARKALDSLAIGRHEPHASMSPEDRSLRKRLRAHGRQLGDERDKQKGTQTTRRLEREVAYEHWHRMLFARFLSENGLLIEPKSQVAVTLHECKELAEEADTDPWELAASFAERMLPRIFRTDDPALEVTLPPETRNALHQLVGDLPTDVFTADDSLGWTYQFWQSAEKEAVNARGEKITGETLPAVTQLFTEPYMVQFLLHNTVGAWHAGKVLAEHPEIAKNARSEQELRDAVALDGYAFDYLRFVRTPLEGEDLNAGTGPWRPAAGTYDGWPKQASELTVLDPCCGSGHFLVAAFDLLVHLRRAEEYTGVEDAIRSVLEDNLFGLELDARCTQIAAFQLALAAWRTAQAPIDLPPLSIACSGLGPNSTKEEWLELAESAAARGGMPSDRNLYKKEESLLSEPVRRGLEQLYETFESAPELGSLIDPAAQASDLLVAGFEQIAPLLDDILAADDVDAAQHERAVAASGMARAAKILVGPKAGYTLVLTNVPYLGRGSHSDAFRRFVDEHYETAKSDLATVFLARMLRWVRHRALMESAGTIAAVTPQNWHFLSSYRAFRCQLLDSATLKVLARLGPNAFRDMNWWAATTALSIITQEPPHSGSHFWAIDASTHKEIHKKIELLTGAAHDAAALVTQASRQHVPDQRFSFDPAEGGDLLEQHACSLQGVSTADLPRFSVNFWEITELDGIWTTFQGAAHESEHYAGRECVIRLNTLELEANTLGAAIRGKAAWTRRGVAVRQMRHLPVTISTGGPFDTNVAVILPELDTHFDAIWTFCQSPEYHDRVRRLDQKTSVTNATLVKVPFDLNRWKKEAKTLYPMGPPEPRSDSPTQWPFHGHVVHTTHHAALQVAVARLVGYRWPAELDEEMRLAPEARALVQRCAELAEHADDDGIVCLSSIQGEGSAADRLRSLLASAFGTEWSASREADLLRAAGEHFHKGTVQQTLDVWLRDRFFEEHCALFHKRPFAWHVWDGLLDGFHALVNYHRLAGPDGEGKRTLQKLTSTYLGEWIERQRQQLAAKVEGAEARLDAATALQDELRKIQEGEPPYDLFVRWKPLHEQPLGWDPDINDGVRLNIRPFLMAKDVGRKNAGILRAKPDTTWSNKKKPGVKDRGTEPQSIRPRLQFPWFWGCDPEDHTEHRTDFGSGLPGTAPAGDTFDGQRWNNLHYTRGAKEAARERHEA